MGNLLKRIFIIFSLFHGASSNTIHGPTNGEVTLKPGVEGVIEDILWKHQGNKMVDWDLTAGGKPSEYLRFKGRTNLNTKTADVTIQSLTKEDNGLYEAEVQIGGLLRHRQLELKVTDPVTDATITCKSSDESTTLHCSAVGDSLTYSWSGPGLPTAGMSGQTGPQISHENQDSVYTCNVSNPVSHSSVSFHSRDCSDSGNLTMIIGISCAVAAAVIIIIIGIAVIFKVQRSKRNNKATEKNKMQQTTPLMTDKETDCDHHDQSHGDQFHTMSGPKEHPETPSLDGDQHLTTPEDMRTRIDFWKKKEEGNNSPSPALIGKPEMTNKDSVRYAAKTELFRSENDQNSEFSGGRSGSFDDTSAGDGNVSEKTVEEVCEPGIGEDTKKEDRGDAEGEGGNTQGEGIGDTEGAGGTKNEDGEIKEDGGVIKGQEGGTKGAGDTKGENRDTQEGERETKGAADSKGGHGDTHEEAGETKGKEGGTTEGGGGTTEGGGGTTEGGEDMQGVEREDTMGRKGGTTGVEGVVDSRDRDTKEGEGEAVLKEDTMEKERDVKKRREFAKRGGGDIQGEKADSEKKTGDTEVKTGDTREEAGDPKEEAGDPKEEAGDTEEEAGDPKEEAGDTEEEAGDTEEEGDGTKKGCYLRPPSPIEDE